MEVTDAEYQRLRAEASSYYQSIGSVRCPYFGDEPVRFTNEGFDHLVTANQYRVRVRAEQVVRFGLLRHAVGALRRSGTLQEYEERMQFVRQKMSHGWTRSLKIVRYYGFIAVLEDVRIRIAVRQIEGGTKHFYSVHPYWRTVSDGRGGYVRVFSGRNGETD